MFTKEDVLEEYIKKEESRGHPYWAIKRALRREGIDSEELRKVMGRRLFRRKAYKNLVFFFEILIWLFLIIFVSISSKEGILLIIASFSPILLNYLASFYIVKNLKEKFLLFIMPFITTAIVYIIFVFVANDILTEMDVATLTILNIAIGLIFNIFIYFVNDYRNINVRPPKDDERAEKVVTKVLMDSHKDIEALREEFSKARVPQKEIIHDLAEIKAEETPEIAKQKMVIATIHGAKFHKPGCMVINDTNSKEIVHFKDKEDAIRRGYRPCKVCLPEE